ncbi:uncharacterized protein LOC144283390 isoform X2 [Canis aureus]
MLYGSCSTPHGHSLRMVSWIWVAISATLKIFMQKIIEKLCEKRRTITTSFVRFKQARPRCLDSGPLSQIAFGNTETTADQRGLCSPALCLQVSGLTAHLPHLPHPAPYPEQSRRTCCISLTPRVSCTPG